MGLRIKTGDQVIVVAGAAKGRTGKVTKVFPETNKLIVEGVNTVQRHSRPTPTKPEGGIVSKQLPIHRSNVMLVDPATGKGSRVRVQTNEAGKKVRVAVKSGTVLDS